MDRSDRAKRVFWAVVDKLKSLSLTIFLLTLGLADYLDVASVRSLLDQVVGPDRAARAAVWVPIVFAVFRSAGQFGWKRRGDEDECNQSKEH